MAKKRVASKPDEVALGRVVTPMLDMTFQLLFYFVMQFKPPISEGQMDFSLPQEDPGQASTNIAPDLEEKPEVYRLSIIARSGLPEVLSWKTDKGAPENIPIGESVDQTLQAIAEKLKTVAIPGADSKTKPPIIKIEADKKLKYSVLVLIMDTCKKAGFTDVGVMPLPKDKA